MLNKERLKNVFYDMVKIYSPSKGEGEICAWVMDYLKARGLEPMPLGCVPSAASSGSPMEVELSL